MTSLPHRRTKRGQEQRDKRRETHINNTYHDKELREIIAVKNINVHSRVIRQFGEKQYTEHLPPAWKGDVLHDDKGRGLYDRFFGLVFHAAWWR